jgi:uncharacterized DUF497 family protein
VFLDPLAVTYPDPDHSNEEFREITIGYSDRQMVVFLSHTKRGLDKNHRSAKGHSQGAQAI